MSVIETVWTEHLRKYEQYLQYDRNMTRNTVENYMRDAVQFVEFAEAADLTNPAVVTMHDVETFMTTVYDKGVKKSSQARVLSGVKSFFNFLTEDEVIEASPTEFVDAPKLSRELPDSLTVEEVMAIMDVIDLSKPLGHRNRAILETLYGSGIRVSELVSLKLNDLFEAEEMLRIMGKGRKERIVPISGEALKHIRYYMQQRATMPVDPKHEDYLFLNQRGRKLTRVMIFFIIKQAAQDAGITKNISPHTLRHSFATHLLQGGANVRQVQQLLGHESISTTEIYTHLDLSHLRASIEKHHPLKRSVPPKQVK